ncbi:MAG: hypothetical protein ACOX8M_07390 [Marvinbryantia sp.]|jgi:hypothetical protein
MQQLDEKMKKRWNIIVAVALLRDLFDQGEIKEKTFKAITKDADNMLEKMNVP